MAAFEGLIGDTAERAMAGRSRVERSEIVQRVLEALVTDVLEHDPRFYRRASFYGLTARRESDELGRRRAEEAAAEAAGPGDGLQPARYLEPYGVDFDAA